jgi:CheY-like chemotaxis protein
MTKDPINILLVDDQPKLLSYEAILQGLGENLIKAGSAREALEHLLKEDIAIVLSDVCMPELDGFELARMIRNHPRFQQTAIIFVSAIARTALSLFATGVGLMGLSGWRRCPLVAKVSLALAQPSLLIRYSQRIQVWRSRACIVHPIPE